MYRSRRPVSEKPAESRQIDTTLPTAVSWLFKSIRPFYMYLSVPQAMRISQEKNNSRYLICASGISRPLRWIAIPNILPERTSILVKVDTVTVQGILTTAYIGKQYQRVPNEKRMESFMLKLCDKAG